MRRRKNSSSILLLVTFVLLIAGAVFVYVSDAFERDAPVIDMPNSGYWNLKNPLYINMSDVAGIKGYKVTLKSSSEESVLYHEQLLTPSSSLNIKVEPSKNLFNLKDSHVKVVIEATDASKWNFFAGNSAIKEYSLVIDKKKPNVSVIANSYKITRGGSALVIFKAEDENIKDIHIQTEFGKKFLAQPFLKDGYYIALIAWPVQVDVFRANVVVEDMAGNVTTTYIPLYLNNMNYRVSKIELKENFLKGKIAELAEEFDETQGISDDIARFKMINETVREKNEKLIYEITTKVPQDMIKDFKLEKMYPLKNGKVVAYFGDHRIYTKEEQTISESYHMGLDLASTQMAEIRPQNGGEVVYVGYNGLYGNMPIIYHGLGLYTLFGHCSSTNVNVGDNIVSGVNIAHTGSSGYAMGDHLHFGVLVQGVEVRPEEWMDESWMRLNITNVIESAKAAIK